MPVTRVRDSRFIDRVRDSSARHHKVQLLLWNTRELRVMRRFDHKQRLGIKYFSARLTTPSLSLTSLACPQFRSPARWLACSLAFRSPLTLSRSPVWAIA